MSLKIILANRTHYMRSPHKPHRYTFIYCDPSTKFIMKLKIEKAISRNQINMRICSYSQLQQIKHNKVKENNERSTTSTTIDISRCISKRLTEAGQKKPIINLSMRYIILYITTSNPYTQILILTYHITQIPKKILSRSNILYQ